MMRRGAVRWFVPMASLALLVSYTQGCERVVHHEVRGTIRSAIDGKPIAGVDLVLLCTPAGTPPKSPDALGGPHGLDASRTDGSFSLRFEHGEDFWRVWPVWSLVLRKDGYAAEVFDISQEAEPAAGPETHLISVVAYMRPSNL